QEQLREIEITPSKLLLEPIGRNTAPALTLAALAALETGDDPILVVTPADHAYSSEPAFHCALNQAVREATHGNIIILGIAPTKPETAYGYIRSAHTTEHDSQALTVLQFVEKPDSHTAL